MQASRTVCSLAKIASDRLLDVNLAVDKHDWYDGLAVRVPNWLGDAAMSLPAIKLLRGVVPPDCAIFAVAPRPLVPFFSSIACIDRVLPLGAAHSLWSRSEIIRLRRSNCGVAVLLNNSFRDAFFFRLAMPFRRIYAPSSRGNDFLLTRSFRLPADGLLSKEHHHASRYLSIANAFGAEKWDAVFPEIKEIKEPETTGAEVMQAAGSDNLLAVAPGAAYGPAKKWPAANFAEVCKWWIDEKKGSVAVLGTAADSRTAADISATVKSRHLANLAGKTDIPDLIRILKSARFCVSNDSGIMHLSAAVGGRGVAIFGSTNPWATGPLSENWTCLHAGLECSPCLDRECRRNSYECLRGVSAHDVIEEIRKSFAV